VYRHNDVYSYVYDINNHLISGVRESEDGSRSEFTYDIRGNIVHQIDYPNSHSNLLSQIHNGTVEFVQTWIAIP